MTTGNLRRCIQLFFESTIPQCKAAGLRDAAGLGVISLSFVLGALAGGLTTHRLHDAALWLPAALLLTALVDIFRHAEQSRVRHHVRLRTRRVDIDVTTGSKSMQ
jgi:uncharacterized membrane protein YoaK (UPF0700 family)